MNAGALALTRFQVAYMSRPYLKVREEFLNKLFVNIGDIGFRDMPQIGGAIEDELIAMVIMAFGAKREDRAELCGKILDALDTLTAPAKKVKTKPVPAETKPVPEVIVPDSQPPAVKLPMPVVVDNGLPEHDRNCVLDTCAKCGKIARFKKMKLVYCGKLIPKVAVECEKCKSVVKPFDTHTQAMLGWNSKQRELREKNGQASKS